MADTRHQLRGARGSHKFQGARDVRLELLAVDNCVQHSVLQQKFSALEALRQLLANGLFDNAGPGKSDGVLEILGNANQHGTGRA